MLPTISRKIERVMTWFLLSLSPIIMVAFFLAFIWPGYMRQVVQPAFDFGNLVSPASPHVVCPGEVLEYSYTRTIHSAPITIRITRTWWSIDQHRTIVYDDNPIFTNWVHEETPPVQEEHEIVVPDLPAGEYHYVHAGQIGTHPTIFLIVEVEIPEGCPPLAE